MKVWKKVVVGVVVAVFAINVAFFALIYASAWYYRWQAGKLLAIVKTVTPGVTTQADYLKAVEPLDNHILEVGDTDGQFRHVPGSLGIGNFPNVTPTMFALIFLPAVYLADHGLLPEATEFTVQASFQDGVVSNLSVEEMQGEGHPFCGHVTLTARRFQNEDDPSFDKRFAGYSVEQMHLQDGTLWESTVNLDERATSEERARAFDFHFNCFTKLGACRDGAKMLQPAPNRPEFEDNR